MGDISRLEGDWPLQALSANQAGHGHPAPVVASQLLYRLVGVGQRSGQPDRPEWSQDTACWASTANWRISSSQAFSAVSGALTRRHLFILSSSLPLHPGLLTPTLSVIRHRRSRCTGSEVTFWGHEKPPFCSTDRAMSNQDPQRFEICRAVSLSLLIRSVWIARSAPQPPDLAIRRERKGYTQAIVRIVECDLTLAGMCATIGSLTSQPTMLRTRRRYYLTALPMHGGE